MNYAAIASMAIGLVCGWWISSTWRGTTRQGYLLALRHVREEMSRRDPKPVREVLETLRTEVVGDR